MSNRMANLAFLADRGVFSGDTNSFRFPAGFSGNSVPDGCLARTAADSLRRNTCLWGNRQKTRQTWRGTSRRHGESRQSDCRCDSVSSGRGTDGSLTGYAGGLTKVLSIEKQHFHLAPSHHLGNGNVNLSSISMPKTKNSIRNVTRWPTLWPRAFKKCFRKRNSVSALSSKTAFFTTSI